MFSLTFSDHGKVVINGQAKLNGQCLLLSSILSPLLLFVLTFISLIGSTLGQDFYAGYYSYHPAYLNDEPNVYHYSKRMFYGLPKGGYSMTGKPFGLTAYVFKLKDWDHLWTHYYSLESAYAPVRYYGHPQMVDDLLNFWH